MSIRILYPLLIISGITSGLIGDYSSDIAVVSKLLPPPFAFAVWAPIYLVGIWAAFRIAIGQISPTTNGLLQISLGYFFSGLWIRFDGQTYVVAFLAISTLLMNLWGVYLLRDSLHSRYLLNGFAIFAAWITVATSLTISDALKISNSSDLSVGLYLAGALIVTFTLYFLVAPLYGYIGVISWVTFSLLFQHKVSGTPITAVAAVALLASLLTIVMAARGNVDELAASKVLVQEQRSGL